MTPQPRKGTSVENKQRKARTARELTADEKRMQVLQAKDKLTDAEAAEKKTLAAKIREHNFNRLAAPRVKKALKAIDQIAKLSGNQYSYTEKNVDNIDGYLSEAVERCINALKKNKSVSEVAINI